MSFWADRQTDTYSNRRIKFETHQTHNEQCQLEAFWIFFFISVVFTRLLVWIIKLVSVVVVMTIKIMLVILHPVECKKVFLPKQYADKIFMAYNRLMGFYYVFLLKHQILQIPIKVCRGRSIIRQQIFIRFIWKTWYNRNKLASIVQWVNVFEFHLNMIWW